MKATLVLAALLALAGSAAANNWHPQPRGACV